MEEACKPVFCPGRGIIAGIKARSTRIPGGSAIFYVKISEGRKSKCLYLLIEMRF